MTEDFVDFRGFLKENFETPEKLARFLELYGVDPPKDTTIYQWFRRGSVPAKWAFLLAGLLEIERGSEPIVSKHVRLRP